MNAVCPGYIATDMVMAVPEKVRESIIAQIPVGRLGEVDEIARCVVDMKACVDRIKEQVQNVE